jgi:segregation and condensation protein B
MRRIPNQPGEQLRSVAARFRTSLPGGSKAAGARLDPPIGQVELGRGATADAPFTSCPSARTADLARLEAVLLLAHEPLSSRKLAQYANLADGTQARTLIRRLNEHYDAAGRAFRVEHVAGGYQLLTRRKFSAWLRRLAHVPGETRLSAPALETLAVIAYRQPVPRADIEAIRGVNCGEILRQLLERDLVRIGGRSDELGRPYLYATTRRFQQLFGLVNLDELPRAELLRSAPLPVAAPSVTMLAETAVVESESYAMGDADSEFDESLEPEDD